MKWFIWVLAAVIVIASFPLAIAAKPVRKGNAAGITMVIGLALMTVMDPKTAAMVELIERRKEIGEEEPGEDEKLA
jgi:hypothetical protein